MSSVLKFSHANGNDFGLVVYVFFYKFYKETEMEKKNVT